MRREKQLTIELLNDLRSEAREFGQLRDVGCPVNIAEAHVTNSRSFSNLRFWLEHWLDWLQCRQLEDHGLN